MTYKSIHHFLVIVDSYLDGESHTKTQYLNLLTKFFDSRRTLFSAAVDIPDIEFMFRDLTCSYFELTCFISEVFYMRGRMEREACISSPKNAQP